MLYDEETGEYKPRFGYKRIKNGLEDIPIVEVKAGQDPFADPWSEDRREKKERVKKNLKNQVRNMSRNSKGSKSAPTNSYDSSLVAGIPIDLSEKKGKKGKQGVRKTLELVQHSTASLGR